MVLSARKPVPFRVTMVPVSPLPGDISSRVLVLKDAVFTPEVVPPDIPEAVMLWYPPVASGIENEVLQEPLELAMQARRGRAEPRRRNVLLIQAQEVELMKIRQGHQVADLVVIQADASQAPQQLQRMQVADAIAI